MRLPLATSSASLPPLPTGLALLLLGTPLARAGGDETGATLVVDPSSHDALTAANHYVDARAWPPGHVVALAPVAPDLQATFAERVAGVLGEHAQRGTADQTHFVVLAPGTPYRTDASNLASDACVAVHHFSATAPYVLAFERERILAGGYPASESNGYAQSNYIARGFDSSIAWFGGNASSHPNARRYLVAGLLGYTGANGNTLDEVLDLIARSAPADSTHPAGTVYYMQTNDLARSGPRHDFYPTAVDKMIAAGGQAEHLFAVLPLGETDCMGVMTGIASADVDGGGFTLLPGSFGDHLTSFAGHFDTASQTKMSEWIRAGASGTSGAVEEPCNYPGKFPHARLHVLSRKGLTLGESWLRSLDFEPYQQLFLGDPLTRPYAKTPTVVVAGVPAGPASGTVPLVPTAAIWGTNAAIAGLELHVDGVRVQAGPDGTTFDLDTTALDEGWHDLRVVAFDDRVSVHRGAARHVLEVDNLPEGVSASVAAPAGDLSTAFAVDYATTGPAPTRVTLHHLDRVVASGTAATGALTVHGHPLGAGPARVQVVAHFPGGLRARSAPLVLDVQDAVGAAPQATPVAFDHHRRLRDDAPAVVELPATFDDDPGQGTWTLVTPPAQALVLGSGGPWCVLEPLPGASGPDLLTFEVTTAQGTSNLATVTLEWFDGDGCPGLERYCVGAPNSAGPGAAIDFTGSTHLAANDLVLTATGAAPDQFALFFQGQGRTQQPLADGFLCLAGNHARYGALLLDGTGAGAFAVDLGAPPLPGAQVQPGDTWAFQLWYRDPAAGGAGSNLSDAIELTFCP